MKVLTIIGARPQFIKAVVVSNALKENNIEEIIVHTGQHFDKQMSDIFFKQLKLREPDENLNINSLSHGAMTGRMIEQIEKQLLKYQPDIVLVYGDTNSTLAGAIATKKLNIALAHVEAGLRSFNMKMPEEINRILTDRISDLLFCPTEKAIENLKKEGFDNFPAKIIYTGDVMKDTALFFKKYEQKPNFKIPEKFAVCTIHREENTNNIDLLTQIFEALHYIANEIPIIIPLHPRTQKILSTNKICINNSNIIITDPVGYLEMIYLLNNCQFVITDSGGLQKEAYFFNKKILILRNETEWVELVDNNIGFLAGNSYESIVKTYNSLKNHTPNFNVKLYGDGNAAKIIVEALKNFI